MNLLEQLMLANKPVEYSSKHYEPVGKKIKDLTGQTFGKLTVTRGEYLYQKDYVECSCECGGTKKARVSSLLHKQTKSCGCIRQGGSKAKSERSRNSLEKLREEGVDVEPKLSKNSTLSKMYAYYGIAKK